MSPLEGVVSLPRTNLCFPDQHQHPELRRESEVPAGNRQSGKGTDCRQGEGEQERTFYRYFRTKEDVIFPDAEEKMLHVDELVASLPESMSVVEGLREGMRAISLETQDSTELQLARARLVMSTPSLQTQIMQREQEWVESFADAVAGRLDLDQDADIRPELTAAVIVAVFRVVMNRWIRSGGRERINDMIDDALAYVGAGLAV